MPYAPGGGTDVQARLIAAKLTEAWGQPVIIDNRPGGGTVIGTEAVARAAPDGYTLLIGTPTHVVNVALYAKLPFDPIRDFEPVTLMTASPNIFVAHPSVPVRNTKEFIALAKAKPGQITYGSSGNGGTGHLAMEMLKQMAQIQAVHVPYKGGGPAINAVLTGEVSVLINNMIPTVQQVRAGRLRALGVTSRTRSSAIPEVPTIDESGLKGLRCRGVVRSVRAGPDVFGDRGEAQRRFCEGAEVARKCGRCSKARARKRSAAARMNSRRCSARTSINGARCSRRRR